MQAVFSNGKSPNRDLKYLKADFRNNGAKRETSKYEVFRDRVHDQTASEKRDLHEHHRHAH